MTEEVCGQLDSLRVRLGNLEVDSTAREGLIAGHTVRVRLNDVPVCCRRLSLEIDANGMADVTMHIIPHVEGS
jgi:hypothetical protein